MKYPIEYEATADVDGKSQFGVYLIYNKRNKVFYFVNDNKLIQKKSSEIHNIKIERRACVL